MTFYNKCWNVRISLQCSQTNSKCIYHYLNLLQLIIRDGYNLTVKEQRQKNVHLRTDKQKLTIKLS